MLPDGVLEMTGPDWRRCAGSPTSTRTTGRFRRGPLHGITSAGRYGWRRPLL